MITKGKKLYSILGGKCPKCHEEAMYLYKNPYRVLFRSLEMKERCGNCGLKYQIEPSFFYGSMYVSYAVGVAFGVAAFVVSHVFFDAGFFVSFMVITGTLIGFLPIISRLSRNIWINMFVHFDPEVKKGTFFQNDQ